MFWIFRFYIMGLLFLYAIKRKNIVIKLIRKKICYCFVFVKVIDNYREKYIKIRREMGKF